MQERTEASYFVAMSCRIIWELGMRWWNTERCSLKANFKGYVSISYCASHLTLCSTVGRWIFSYLSALRFNTQGTTNFHLQRLF